MGNTIRLTRNLLLAGLLFGAAGPLFADNGYKGLPWGAPLAELLRTFPAMGHDAPDAAGVSLRPVHPAPPFHAVGEALLFLDRGSYERLYDYHALPEASLDAGLGSGRPPAAYTSLGHVGAPVLWFDGGGLVAVTLSFLKVDARAALEARYGARGMLSIAFVTLRPLEPGDGARPFFLEPTEERRSRVEPLPALRWRFSGATLRVEVWQEGDRVIVWDDQGNGIQQVSYLESAWFRLAEKRALAAAGDALRDSERQLRQLD